MNDSDELPPPVVTGAPERIWLNVGDIDDDCAFGELSELTWCADQQFPADIEYVRADIASAPALLAEVERLAAENERLVARVAELEGALRELVAWQDDPNIPDNADEYQAWIDREERAWKRARTLLSASNTEVK